ncbi:MAG TPA: 3'-5' exonuclease, partial [Spirochaetia bacterium]|nr:3'-5' exonuclease [Spirochaetia bacterium]
MVVGLLQSVGEGPGLAKRLEELTAPTSELDEGLLVSATYDGDKRKAVLKFYDSERERVWLWDDNTGHRPYCYTRLSEAEIASAGVAVGKNGVVAIETAVRRDLLSDSEVSVRKITASDPLAIGGSPGSLREKIECWEADIKYFENYVYDRGLKVGTYYKIAHGELAPVEKEVAGEVRRSLDSILAKATGDAAAYIKAWAELLGQPLTNFKRIACDIEVANEENRIPDPEIADREVIAVSFYNDKESIVYMIDKTGQDKSLEGALTGYSHTVFPDEASLLRATFAKMMDYPFLITFNGDDFDLRYLKHRAMRKEIGIKEEEIPIALQRQEASLKHGVHIDLYRFFNNRSIQVYVYNNRYTEHTLNGIAEALLGKEKFSFEGNIAELPLVKLADYCLNDSSLTYELTSANDSLLMKMLLVIARIAKMPMNDAA